MLLFAIFNDASCSDVLTMGAPWSTLFLMDLLTAFGPVGVQPGLWPQALGQSRLEHLYDLPA